MVKYYFSNSAGDPTAVPVSDANPLPVSGAGGGGGASTIADGADVAEGAVADAAVAAGAAGSVSAKLRRLTTDLNTLLGYVDGIEALLALSKGAGVVDGTTLRAVLASDGPTVTVLGGTTDAAVGDATGSINAHVRQVAKALADGTQIAKPKTLLVTGTGINANDTPVAATDVSDYRWVSVQLTGNAGSCQMVFEVSNDNANWKAIDLYDTNQAATTTFQQAPNTTASVFVGAIHARYFRTRITVASSGTVTGTALFSSAPSAFEGVKIFGSSGSSPNVIANAASDGVQVSNLLSAQSMAYVYSGASNAFDRQRNNHEATVLASAARTVATNSADQTNFNAKKIKIVIDITAVAGSPSLTFTVKGKSTLSGKYFTLLASAALTGVGTTVLTISPGATPAANLVANDFVPRVFRVEVAVGTADSVTYSVDCQFAN